MKILNIATKILMASLLVVLAILVINRYVPSNVLATIGADFARVSVIDSALPSSTPQETDPPKLPSFPPQYPVNFRGVQRSAVLETTIPSRPRVDIASYEVQSGDNLFAIADQYGLNPETVLWGNYDILRDNPQFLKPGQVLNILPVDGVYYQWNSNDTISTVADFFDVEPQKIIEWPGNKIDLFEAAQTDPSIAEGNWLIIPGGRRALKDWGPPAITRANPAVAKYYGSGYCGQIYEGAIGTGVFVWPTTGTYISGYGYNPSVHPGLDIGGAEGNAVYASDSGVVVYSGWSEWGFGYLIVLDHGNGWQTAYAHLSAVGVTCGQSAARGTMIGRVGNTGNSSGPHLHFEMRSEFYGKVNPWNFVSP